MPFAALAAADEKNRGNGIAIRDDLATASEAGSPKSWGLQAEAPGWRSDSPAAAGYQALQRASCLAKILDRDLVAWHHRRVKVAGKWAIDKPTTRPVLDVHLRTTFGTLLSKGRGPSADGASGDASPRHRLTMGVYTDPRLLDVRGPRLLPLPLGREQPEGSSSGSGDRQHGSANRSQRITKF